MTKGNNNNAVLLHKLWLIIIVIAAIGSPFLAFATMRGEVKANTDGRIVNRDDIKDLEITINDPKTGLAALNGKMDTLINLVGNIEQQVRKNSNEND